VQNILLFFAQTGIVILMQWYCNIKFVHPASSIQVEKFILLVNVCKILVGKCEGKRSLGRSSHRLEDNIRMDFMEIG
jgi:hypothetical protein